MAVDIVAKRLSLAEVEVDVLQSRGSVRRQNDRQILQDILFFGLRNRYLFLRLWIVNYHLDGHIFRNSFPALPIKQHVLGCCFTVVRIAKLRCDVVSLGGVNRRIAQAAFVASVAVSLAVFLRQFDDLHALPVSHSLRLQEFEGGAGLPRATPMDQFGHDQVDQDHNVEKKR